MQLETKELLRILAPFIVLNYSMAFFCLFLIWKKGTENLTKLIWSIIVLLITGLGSIAFLVLGRKKSYD
jgi:hypothetical protein